MKSFLASYSEYVDLLKALFLPKSVYESVLDIPYDMFYDRGFRAMMFDVDNTLLPRSERVVSLEFQNWIEKIKAKGFKVYLVSNNSSYRRIKKVADQLQVTGTYFSMKPLPYCTKDVLVSEKLTPEKTLFVGDQILTDVAVGNWLKMKTVLVDPIDKKMSFIKTVQREIELYLVERLMKTNHS